MMDDINGARNLPEGENSTRILWRGSYWAAGQTQEREGDQPRWKNNPAQRPLPPEKASCDHGTRYPLATRVQVLTFHTVGFTPKQIFEMIKVPQRQTLRIVQKATERGYRPREDLRILEHYVEDGVKSGRPRASSRDQERRQQGGRQKTPT